MQAGLPCPAIEGGWRSPPLSVGLIRQAQPTAQLHSATGKPKAAPITTPSPDGYMVLLSRLVPSPRQARRSERKIDLDSMMALVTLRGLVQNPRVVPTESDTDEADTGGRPLAALKQLTGQEMIASDHPIPSRVVILEQGFELSLAESLQCVAIDVMNKVDASAARVANGVQAADVARRFDLPVSSNTPRRSGSDLRTTCWSAGNDRHLEARQMSASDPRALPCPS